MKMSLLSLMLILIAYTSYSHHSVRIDKINSVAQTPPTDSVKLQIDGNSAYYQKTVKVDTGITVSDVYIRTLQFMAAKNFQQNYGYEQEGKLIFTTTQDLNTSPVIVNNDNADVDPYTTQFSITVDMKNGRYRYTIQNVLFYLPTQTGNRRLTLYDLYAKATNKDSRRIAREAKDVMTSFERYINSLTTELYDNIQHKAIIFDPKF